jgi:hypothetical protein
VLRLAIAQLRPRKGAYGRPYIWGLAAFGEAGVACALQLQAIGAA